MTITTKSIKKTKKPSDAVKKRFSKEEIEHAVAYRFRDIKGRIAIKHLWTKESVHRFRVNWWSKNQIESSKYVIVVEKNNNLVVKDIKD